MHPRWALVLVAVLLVAAFVVVNHYAPGAGIVVAVVGIGVVAQLGVVLGERRR